MNAYDDNVAADGDSRYEQYKQAMALDLKTSRQPESRTVIGYGDTSRRDQAAPIRDSYRPQQQQQQSAHLSEREQMALIRESQQQLKSYIDHDIVGEYSMTKAGGRNSSFAGRLPSNLLLYYYYYYVPVMFNPLRITLDLTLHNPMSCHVTSFITQVDKPMVVLKIREISSEIGQARDFGHHLVGKVRFLSRMATRTRMWHQPQMPLAEDASFRRIAKEEARGMGRCPC